MVLHAFLPIVFALGFAPGALKPGAQPVLDPVQLDSPPWSYTLENPASEFISLQLLKCAENRVTDYEDWFEGVGDWPAATYHNGGINDEIRGSVPPGPVESVIIPAGEQSYHLYMIIQGPEKALAFYGSAPNRFGVVLDPRYLMIMDPFTFDQELLLDFTTYSHAPSDREGESDFTFQELQWAVVENSVLYVSTAHRTYADCSGGQNAYITAIDLGSQEILWRSRSLVSNSENFIITGDTIVTGYGFSAERDYIYLLNRLTGQVMETYSVPSAPEYMYMSGDRLYVRCYDCDRVYRVTGGA